MRKNLKATGKRTQQLPIIESFRFEDEDDYEYKIFSIPSSARARAIVLLAGKRDSLVILQWNLDLTKCQGTEKSCSLYRGFVI